VEWIWKGKKATSEPVLVDNFPQSHPILSVLRLFNSTAAVIIHWCLKLCDAQNRYCPPAFCIITLFGMFSRHDLGGRAHHGAG
jgi:hypothetical protein